MMDPATTTSGVLDHASLPEEGRGRSYHVVHFSGHGVYLDEDEKEMSHPVVLAEGRDDALFFAKILEALDPPRDAVLLYGSHARGDATPRSDIDVLQIVPHRRPSYGCGRLSVTTATEESLGSLAASGSLFVLHCCQDGVLVRDTSHVLEDILDSYRAPVSYEPLRESLRLAAGILDVDARGFERNPCGLTQLAVYLLRSALYLRCVEGGRPLFSMREVAGHLQDQRVLDVFHERDQRPGDPQFFEHVCAILAEYLGAPVKNTFGSIEALAAHAEEKSPLAAALALRVLRGAPTTYADLLPDGIAA
jgi:Nucleotidyltransferase domain